MSEAVYAQGMRRQLDALEAAAGREAAVGAQHLVAAAVHERPGAALDAQAAAQLLRDRGVAYAFLMHDWPGEPRPSAMIALKTLEAYLEHA